MIFFFFLHKLKKVASCHNLQKHQTMNFELTFVRIDRAINYNNEQLNILSFLVIIHHKFNM
jgi:hypothetical protein